MIFQLCNLLRKIEDETANQRLRLGRSLQFLDV